MICKHCGGELVKEVKFCTFCGGELLTASEAPIENASIPTASSADPIQVSVPLASSPALPKSKGKYLLFGLCGAVLGALLLAVILLVSGVISIGSPKAKNSGLFGKAGTSIQGAGYDTPEQAAEAYLEALKNQDLDAMVATFAVESYVENFDFEAYLNRLQSFQPGSRSYFSYPNNDEYMRQLNIATRVSSITQTIDFQYIVFNALEVIGQGGTTVLSGEEEIKGFIAEYEKATENYVFEDLKITGTLAPAELVEAYASDRNKENMDNRARVLGLDGDDIADVAITFEANGQDWIFCPELVKYNDKWYMESFLGTLGNFLGLSSYSGGIIPDDF